MPTSVQIDELLHRWESARRQGAHQSAEALCADCPHLIDEVRQRIRAVLDMERILGVSDTDPQRTMATPTNGIGATGQAEPLPVPTYTNSLSGS